MRRWHCNTGKCHSLKDNRCRPCRASWWRRRALVDTVELEWAELAELALEVASDALVVCGYGEVGQACVHLACISCASHPATSMQSPPISISGDFMPAITVA